jgi:hypothetical protein
LVRKVVRKTGIDGASFVELFYRAQQVRGESLVHLFIVRQVDHFQGAGQEVIGLSVAVDLDLGRARGRDAVSAREEPEQIVEAVVLKINDDDGLDVVQRFFGEYAEEKPPVDTANRVAASANRQDIETPPLGTIRPRKLG